MKRLTLLVLALMLGFAGALSAQNILAGNTVVGGSLSGGLQMGTLTYYEDDIEILKNNKLGFGLGGFVGYFITNGLEIGPDFYIDYEKRTYKDTENWYSDLYFGIGLQIGYYFALGGMVVPYARVSGIYGGYNYKQEVGGVEYTYKETLFGVIPRVGAAIFVTESAAFTADLYFLYRIEKSKDITPEEKLKYIYYGLSFGISVFL